MSPSPNPAAPADPGLEALLLLLHLKDVAADRGQLRHRLGTDKIGAPEMIRCARDLGLKARAWLRAAATRHRLRHALEVRHDSFRDPAFVELLRRGQKVVDAEP